jgi:class 3 adenylate cyclase
MIKDPWGTWLTGYAPITDAAGNYVATLGVDISADLVNTELNWILIYSLISFGISLLLALVLANIMAQRVARSLNALMKATLEIGKGDLTYRTQVYTHDEFGALANSMNKMAEGLEEKERLKSGFAHYVSQHVLEKIIKEKGAPQLGGERRKITVLFSDIRDFTHLAESMPPEQVVSLLNEYFKTMIDIIFKHNGMLDKLIGDGIMAEFGAPLEDPEQEKNAVRTAIEMHETLKVLCEKWKKEGKPSIEVGIGIHTGEAIIGTIGSEQRMEFTAIGDTVNVASRLEAVTKEGQYNIIISESTYKALYGEFEAKHLGLLSLPGKELPVNAYAIISRKKEEPQSSGK